jgi:hypothetical protein
MRVATVCLIAALVAFAGAVAVANAANNTFTEGPDDNYWDTNGNWSLDHPPTTSDHAIIPDAENCVIRSAGSDAVAESFEIAAASLTIEAGRKLTITEDSLLEGLLTIKGSGGSIGALVIDGTVAILSVGLDGHSHIVLEGGKITGTGSDHVTVIADGIGQAFDITGYGEISVPLTSTDVPVIATGSGKTLYLKDHAMSASDSDTVWGTLSSGTLQVDVVISGSGAWRAWGGGGIILNEATCVTGDVEVDDGTFTFNDSFCTTGEMAKWQDGTIQVAQSKAAVFSVSSCSSQAFCP